MTNNHISVKMLHLILQKKLNQAAIIITTTTFDIVNTTQALIFF